MPAFLSFLSHDLGGWGIAALGNLVDYVNSPEKGNALQHYHSFLPGKKGFFLRGVGVIVSAVVFNHVCVLAKAYRIS